MNWNAYLPVRGRLPYFPSLASAVDDAELGLFLAVNASLTAEAGGRPWVRYPQPQLHPSWHAVFPCDTRKLKNLVARVYDAQNDPVPLLRELRPFIRRENVVFHFGAPEVLAILGKVLNLQDAPLCPIKPGTVWWEGPIRSWQERLVAALLGAGMSVHSAADTSSAIDVVLDELYRDCLERLVIPREDYAEWLWQHIWKRYSPVERTALSFLEYDLIWATIRRHTGLFLLRPSNLEAGQDSKLRLKLKQMLEKLAGTPLETYLRTYRKRCTRTGARLTLADILEVHPDDLHP